MLQLQDCYDRLLIYTDGIYDEYIVFRTVNVYSKIVPLKRNRND
jgi:hypothetical protein